MNKPACLTRRHFLASKSLSISSVALAWMLDQDNAFGKPVKPELEAQSFDQTQKQPHFEPQAKA